ncbi:hypothetical protein O181_030786 [Austropuccinia psidii MF-1]|uniref:AMP-dependent synthetase/ligase domain-containing protein n=1 Tax=Austropuccinia psidii MF-1 TaxID=1389203 RepID=A0A9Q3CTL9_9BASI|nr:hypothetical protein [Austropuccinia psidii MF-1]
MMMSPDPIARSPRAQATVYPLTALRSKTLFSDVGGNNSKMLAAITQLRAGSTFLGNALLRIGTLSSCPKPEQAHPFKLSSTTRGLFKDPDSSQTESYVVGEVEPRLIEETLWDHWSSEILPAFHYRPALISKFEPSSAIYQTNRNDCLRLTYSQLDHASNSLANGLFQIGIRKGDRVGINSNNHSIYPILQWATAKLGAILTTINPAYSLSELTAVLKKVDCKVLFSCSKLKSKDAIPTFKKLFEQNPELISHLILIDNESHLSNQRSNYQIFNNFNNNSKVIDSNEILCNFKSKQFIPPPALNKHDIINLQFTSGTTGLPKAASLTHHNLINNAHHIASRLNLKSEDLVCNVPPMFHCFGLIIGALATFVKGATLVLPSENFNAESAIHAVAEERCTVLNGVGTMFLAEIQALERLGSMDLSSLRTGVVAGSPVPANLMKQIEEKLGLKELTILYGMTETSPGSFHTKPSDNWTKRTETVGTIYPHLRAKVVDLNDRKIVKRGQKGEFMVSGYAVQKGYWQDEAETKKAMEKDEEGRVWMKSGDLAIMDPDGYLQIVGRTKDVIIRGGENLFPVAIESCITSLEGVLEVAIVGVSDEYYGEVVGAFVKRKALEPSKSDTQASIVTIEKICERVRNEMSSANIPKYIWFLDSINRSEFPITGSGKIKKTELREWAMELIGKGKKNSKIYRK